MELDWFKTFQVVARLKSFTLAAEELSLSQPAVSIRIRAMEKESRASFFDRVGKRVVLTQAGEIMLAFVDDTFKRLEDTRRELDGLRGVRTGRLVLGASQVVGIYLLPKLLRKFKGRYPGINIELQVDYGHEIVERVLGTAVDLALVGERESMRDPRLVARRYLSDDLVVVVGSQHPWADRSEVDVGELRNQPFIISRENSAVWAVVSRRLETVGVTLPTDMQFGASDAVKRAIQVGLGVSIMPRLGIAEEDTQADRLRTLALRGIPTRFDLCLVWRKDRRLPVVVETFLAFLDERDTASVLPPMLRRIPPRFRKNEGARG